MKKTLLTLSLIIAIFTVNAQVLLYESFDYPVNDTLTQHGWTGINGGDSIVVVAGNLDYSGLVPSTGNKIAFGGYGRDYQYAITSQATGTVYMSFIMNVTNIDLLDATGGYFTGLGATNTNFCSSVWTKKGSTGYNIGLNARTTVAYTTFDTQEMTVGTPVFVVVSYEMVAGTTNDIAKMWINPVSTTFGTATPPAATITITNGGTDLTPIERIFIRQDSNIETPELDMDEIRVGLTWADVTPAPANVSNIEMNKLSIYPVPATSQVTITANDMIQSIQIFDIQGRLVQSVDMVNANNANVEISTLANGIYNVVATGVNGGTFVSKLVK
ncbi:MAG: hypothetical protein CVU05_07060 [Bacteroidetes bacterium HGW-Bacteroidetes-21]|jgi:hypothetical protein|nr:MAG: hypothetical protein CVU05_07060 [Bacteroidetes bacterium HGW-Bacteroidetes-21]